LQLAEMHRQIATLKPDSRRDLRDEIPPHY
jgi:hypothetical protein